MIVVTVEQEPQPRTHAGLFRQDQVETERGEEGADGGATKELRNATYRSLVCSKRRVVRTSAGR